MSSAAAEMTDEADLARACAYLEPAGSVWRAVRSLCILWRAFSVTTSEQAITGGMVQAEPRDFANFPNAAELPAISFILLASSLRKWSVD